MTIEQGMNKLAKVLGTDATFNITVNVWNNRDNSFTKGDNRVEYSVWIARMRNHYVANTVAKAVTDAIHAHRVYEQTSRMQDPDQALENVA